MKKLILFILLFHCVSILFAQPSVNPDFTVCTTTEFTFSYFSFINSLTGFLVDNRPYTPSNQNFKITTDGGLTWTSSLLGGNKDQIVFLNQSTGYSRYSNIISRTTNSGTNWTSLGISNNVREITFINDSVGFFINGGTGINQNPANQIYRTTDRGNTWTVILSSYHPNSFSLQKIEFINAYTGFASGLGQHFHIGAKGEITPVFDSTEFLKTTNGGTNWTKVFFPAAYKSNSWESYGPLKFFDANTGYVQTYVSGHYYILKTTNGGANWNLQKDLGSTYFREWQFLDENRIWGYNIYYILKSSDLFATLTRENVYDTTDYYYGGKIFDDGNAYIYSRKWKKLYKAANYYIAPVELSSFISSVNNRNVSLSWSTVNEQNNSGFDIERKLFESSEWNKIGNVTGAGTTNSTSDYSYTDKNLSTGKYNYRLKQIDFNGNFKYYDLTNEVIIGTPNKFDLSQNYPNPFNPSTKINYDLPFDSKVSIKIFDLTGREISSIVNQVQPAGYYSVNFNASLLSSGVYFYSMTAEGGNKSFVKNMKMVLVK
jgi:photosystem II stability/assembly factor-like uncharacterized protein